MLCMVLGTGATINLRFLNCFDFSENPITPLRKTCMTEKNLKIIGCVEERSPGGTVDIRRGWDFFLSVGYIGTWVDSNGSSEK